MKQVPYWGPTDFGSHYTKFSFPRDLRTTVSPFFFRLLPQIAEVKLKEERLRGVIDK